MSKSQARQPQQPQQHPRQPVHSGQEPPGHRPDDPFGSGPQSQRGDPALQGEGNDTAARRARKAQEKFTLNGKVERAAKSAPPPDSVDAPQMDEAAKASRFRARR